MMNFSEYQKLAMRTRTCDDERDALLHGVFGLNSEAGEVASILQKEYQGHAFDKTHLLKECGDCLWFIAEICDALNTSIEEVAIGNIEKLKARYPEGFTAERSLNRVEGDI